jgi:ABC-type transport system involved in cytochrome c biogenesis permease subunit
MFIDPEVKDPKEIWRFATLFVYDLIKHALIFKNK